MSLKGARDSSNAQWTRAIIPARRVLTCATNGYRDCCGDRTGANLHGEIMDWPGCAKKKPLR